jgi:hypothetical protein
MSAKPLQIHDVELSGWHFKRVSADRRSVLAFTPGVSLSGPGSHAFVQMIDGTTGATRFFPCLLDASRAACDSFEIAVGASRFSLHGIEVRASEGSVSVAGSSCSIERDWGCSMPQADIHERHSTRFPFAPRSHKDVLTAADEGAMDLRTLAARKPVGMARHSAVETLRPLLASSIIERCE